jgi:hypothetical protein
MTIFELVQSQELVAYWTELAAQRPPYLGETLFPAQKKLGLDLKWIKGSKGLPVALKLSAFDVKAVIRDRIGFSKVTAEMPFFKESMLIDEALRQELNMVIETGNQAYVDSVMNRVFDDQTSLLEGAAVQRERMRMQLLTTGLISLASNGQAYTYDYGVPETHKVTVTKSWSDVTADILGNIKTGQDLIETDTGIRPTRAICSRKTWGYLLNNTAIKNSILQLTAGAGFVTDSMLKKYLLDALQLEVVVNTKMFKTEAGVATQYVPDDVFTLFPAGKLGSTWFGTTPEESDLMSGSAANVTITDVGVAVTSMKQTDPVNVETKVTQICLPSWETADQVYILDVAA